MTNLCQSVFACKACVTLIKKALTSHNLRDRISTLLRIISLLVAPLFFSFLEFSVRK